jgi:hypothetical protein
MKNDKRDCTSGRKSVVKLQGLPLILVNWIHHLADHLLGPILHLHRTLSMGMISLLVALQSSAIECNAERFQLRQIKQAHCFIPKAVKLLGPFAALIPVLTCFERCNICSFTVFATVVEQELVIASNIR